MPFACPGDWDGERATHDPPPYLDHQQFRANELEQPLCPHHSPRQAPAGAEGVCPSASSAGPRPHTCIWFASQGLAIISWPSVLPRILTVVRARTHDVLDFRNRIPQRKVRTMATREELARTLSELKTRLDSLRGRL